MLRRPHGPRLRGWKKGGENMEDKHLLLQNVLEVADVPSNSHPFSQDLDTWSDLTREVGRARLQWRSWLFLNLVHLQPRGSVC